MVCESLHAFLSTHPTTVCAVVPKDEADTEERRGKDFERICQTRPSPGGITAIPAEFRGRQPKKKKRKIPTHSSTTISPTYAFTRLPQNSHSSPPIATTWMFGEWEKERTKKNRCCQHVLNEGEGTSLRRAVYPGFHVFYRFVFLAVGAMELVAIDAGTADTQYTGISSPCYCPAA